MSTIKKRKIQRFDLENTSDIQSLAKECYSKFIDKLYSSQLTSKDNAQVQFDVILDTDPERFVLCFSSEPFDFSLHIQQLLYYEEACSWYQYGVLKGFMMNLDKQNKIKESFELMKKDLQEDQDIDDDLVRLGYREMKVPRYLEVPEYDEVEREELEDVYIRVSSSLIQKNIPDVISEIASIISQYAWNWDECIAAWCFPKNRAHAQELKNRNKMYSTEVVNEDFLLD